MEFGQSVSYNKTVFFVAVNLLIISTQVFSVVGYFRYTSFQEGVICHAAQQPLRPTSLKEIQNIVVTALRTNYNLKAVGTRHSATDIICTDGVPIGMFDINHFRYNHNTGHATVGAGATLGNFLLWLHSYGRTVYGVATYEDITIGGAIGTGAHGTSFGNPSALSDIIVSLVVVDGLGNIRTISDRQTLRAFRTHLGLLGIIYEITLSTIPQFKLQISNYPQSDAILGNPNELLRLARSHERFQFFWFPSSKRVTLSVGNRVPYSTRGECQTHFIPEASYSKTSSIGQVVELMQRARDHVGFLAMEKLIERSLYATVPGKTPFFSWDGKSFCNPAVGFSHKMTVNRCNQCAWQHGNASMFPFEFATIIPLTELPAALHTINNILRKYPMEFPFTGIYFRFLSASDGLLTLSSDRASVAIEWVLVPRKDRFNKPMLGLSSSQAIMQALFQKHSGRAHWGKNGPLYTRQNILLERFPHLQTFVRYMEHFDPRGVFLNEFGRRLKFGGGRTSVDSYAGHHCALAESCVCQNDRDCGDGGWGSYKCDNIFGYRVCKENLSKLEDFKGKTYRQFIGIL